MHPSGNSDARAIGQQRVGADQGGAVSRILRRDIRAMGVEERDPGGLGSISGWTTSPSWSTTMLRITFCNWRTLPGQR
jgi:hypothetical protein